MGKIDDSLLKRFELKEKIINELKGMNAAALTTPELKRINKNLLQISPLSPELLLEILVGSNELPGELIILLLDEMKDKKILDKVNQLLNKPSLADSTRAQLITLKALKEYGEKSAPQFTNKKDSVNDLLTATEMLWRELEDEEIGSLWLESYWQMDKNDKLVLLDIFLKRGERFYLPVLRLEAENSDVDIVRRVARGLANFGHPNAEKILQRLLQHNDMGVRLDAEYSLKQLKQKPNRPKKIKGPTSRWEFYKSFVGEDPGGGQHTVVYSTISPENDIKFMNVWIDSWDRGIVDCWGNIRYTTDQLAEMIRTFNQKDEFVKHREVEKDYVVYLVRKALELTKNRDYKVPMEFFVWWGMMEDEPYDPDKYHVAFGLKCLECGSDIRLGKRRKSVWVFGDGKALCPRCIRTKKLCARCYTEIKDPSTAFVLLDKDSHEVSVVCKKCHEKIKEEEEQEER
jgi:hypothetical protein